MSESFSFRSTIVSGLLAVLLAACGGAGTAGPGATGPTEPAPATTGGQPTANAEPTGPVVEPMPSKGTAPDFSLATLDGDEVSLSDYEGKVVLIDFWSTTCKPCLQEMPELVQLYKDKKDQGFVVLAITIDGPQTQAVVASVVKSKGMIFPILLDTETAVMDRYDPKGELPFAVVVDRGGHIVLQRASYQPGDEASMKTLVDAIDRSLAAK